jgi:hypothetical protein
MPGYAHITTLEAAEDSEGIHLRQYQFIYTDGGTSFAKALNEEELVQLLDHEIAVPADTLDRVLNELHTIGHSTIRDIEISENEAAAIGLFQAGNDV